MDQGGAMKKLAMTKHQRKVLAWLGEVPGRSIVRMEYPYGTGVYLSRAASEEILSKMIVKERTLDILIQRGEVRGTKHEYELSK